MYRMNYTAPITAAEKAQFVPFLNTLVDTAFDVIVPRFLTGIAAADKADGSPVTAADKLAEANMRRLIEREFPRHGIFGEEWGETDAKETDDVRYRWILDPIDGTRSFITNSFLFGTLIALERDDGTGFRPILSSVSHAAANVRTIGFLDGTVMHLENRGTVIDRPIRVRPCDSLKDATLLATSHWTTGEQHGSPRIQTLIDRVKLYRTMGDCFGYFAVASGGADIMVDPELCYWDIAALIPVVEGAGGTITSISGGNPLTDLNAVCTAGGLHGEVVALLNA